MPLEVERLASSPFLVASSDREVASSVPRSDSKSLEIASLGVQVAGSEVQGGGGGRGAWRGPEEVPLDAQGVASTGHAERRRAEVTTICAVRLVLR